MSILQTQHLRLTLFSLCSHTVMTDEHKIVLFYFLVLLSENVFRIFYEKNKIKNLHILRTKCRKTK